MQYRPLNELTLEEYERVKEEYRVVRRCTHCHCAFREAENFGQFQCRLHPGVCRFELTRAADFYSCCGGASDAPGCRLADHLEDADGERLCELDEAERHEALFEAAYAVVPCGLYRYGLLPPQHQATLWRSDAGRPRKRLRTTAVFNAELEECFVMSELAHQVSEAVRDSPVLLRTLPAAAEQGARASTLTRLEAGWRSSFDDDDDDSEKRATKRAEYALPYVIVQRIY